MADINTMVLFMVLPLLLFGCAASSHHLQVKATDLNAAALPRQDTALAINLTSQAMQQIDQSNWAKAKSLLLKAVDADGLYGPPHNDLGVVYLHDRDLYAAANEFHQAAKLMPFQAEPQANLGLVLEQAGRLDEASDCYDEALHIEKDNPAYVAEAARVRIRRGDKDDRVKALLTQLAAIGSTPEWVQWARRQLMILSRAPATESQQ